MHTVKYPVVDLFCGVGGLSHGFLQEGFDLIAGVDFDKSCRYAYEKNNGTQFLLKDLVITPSSEIEALYPESPIKILVGCAPCQAFSSLSNKYKANDKWKLLYSFGRFVSEIGPDIVSMENVSQLLRYDKGQVFDDFLMVLRNQGYHYTYEVVDSADYGVPQHRHRLILLASKLGPIELIEKTHVGQHITVQEAIGNLPPLGAGERHSTDSLHRSRLLSELNLRRIKATPEGGSWKDWDDELVLNCHKKESGKTFGSVYGRMRWNDAAPTLTTQCTGYGNGRFGHPEQDRAISLREAAILQSFPENYDFGSDLATVSVKTIEKHIGNAVPVILGRVVAQSIKFHLHEYGF